MVLKINNKYKFMKKNININLKIPQVLKVKNKSYFYISF